MIVLFGCFEIGIRVLEFERLDLCLFDAHGPERRLALPACEHGIWHGFLPGSGAGLLYGYRAHGRRPRL